MNVSIKPSRCGKCGAQTIVPLVRGLVTSQKWEELELQKKVLPVGCDGFDDGAPLWGCATCSTLVCDVEYCFSSYETPLFQRYKAELQAIAAAYRPMSDDEYEMLLGRELLEILIRSLFVKRSCKCITVSCIADSAFHVFADDTIDDNLSKMFSTSQFKSLAHMIDAVYPSRKGKCLNIECQFDVHATSISIWKSVE